MSKQAEHSLTFRLLVGYRWISLLLPLLWLLIPIDTGAASVDQAAFAVAVTLTLVITLSMASINRLLLHQPWLLGLDLVISAGLVWTTGVEGSPYYLYSLAPILAGAFFFQTRGGVLAATIYSLLYLAALFALQTPALDWPSAIGQLISFFLIGAMFGYQSKLLQRLRQTHLELAAKNNELAQRHRDLNLVRELSLVMQSSVDPAELQESILRGLINDMGYQRAIIALYDDGLDALSSWITLEQPPDHNPMRMAHTDVVSLAGDTGPLARALKGKLVLELTHHEGPTANPHTNERLATGSHYIVLPLSLRGRSIGVIIVDRLPPGERLSQADRLSLDNLATHAGVALGSLHLCIDRAQRVAVTEERHRIAADLHDNVSQILYGLAYGLDACRQLLPAQSSVQDIIAKLHTSVTDAQALLRQTIFAIRTEDISPEAFVAGLHRQLQTVCPGATTALRIDVPGSFTHWPPHLRNQLYQIAHEALANAVKHARADQIVVQLSQTGSDLALRISDDGSGFDMAAVDTQNHLGLHSMAERTRALEGRLEIDSAPGQGTIVTVTVPHLCQNR